jgi:membrane-associated phospholipid phosphatase
MSLAWDLKLTRNRFRLLVVGFLFAANAQAQARDTIQSKSPLLTGKDALILGAFTAGTVLLAPLDRQIAARLQNPHTQANRSLRTAATGLRLLGWPGSLATGAGLYALGRVDGQSRVQALGLHSVESVLLADILGGGIKMVAGRQRPFADVDNPYSFQLGRGFSDDRYRSFPSGHTTSAFAFASTLTRETQFWWPHATWYVGTIFYGGAALVGLSRVYDNQHWASDVLGGAAIGTLVGLKVVRFTHSHPGNRLDRRLIKGDVRSQTRTIPIGFSFQF